jgi:hypothetical protein
MRRIERTAGAKVAALGLALAAMLLAPAPAGAQLLGSEPLLSLVRDVPIAATLDNPCTAVREAIAFTGTVRLAEDVLQTALVGKLRLILAEQTAIQGRDLLALFGGPLYTAAGASDADVEFLRGALSILSYKKVVASGVNDNFHVILQMVFDPSTLQIGLGLAGACDAGLP